MALPVQHHGYLSLELACDTGRTVIARQRSHPPLQIFGLQYNGCGSSAYLQIVNPCGGLFEGDTAEIEVSAGQGAHLHLTTQAAAKIYPAEHGAMTWQRTRLRVASGAILEYFPLPVIPFAGARYLQEMTIQVEPAGVCLVSEVLAPGRLARGESFAYDMVRSHTEGWMGGQPTLFEQMILEPTQRAYAGLGALDGKCYLATLYVLTSQPLGAWIPTWNRRLAAPYVDCVGITELAHGGLVVRLIGHTGQEVLRRLDAVHRLIREEGLGLPPQHVYRPYT
jgi:urease accessory protein